MYHASSAKVRNGLTQRNVEFVTETIGLQLGGLFTDKVNLVGTFEGRLEPMDTYLSCVVNAHISGASFRYRVPRTPS